MGPNSCPKRAERGRWLQHGGYGKHSQDLPQPCRQSLLNLRNMEMCHSVVVRPPMDYICIHTVEQHTFSRVFVTTSFLAERSPIIAPESLTGVSRTQLTNSPKNLPRNNLLLSPLISSCRFHLSVWTNSSRFAEFCGEDFYFWIISQGFSLFLFVFLFLCSCLFPFPPSAASVSFGLTSLWKVPSLKQLEDSGKPFPFSELFFLPPRVEYCHLTFSRSSVQKSLQVLKGLDPLFQTYSQRIMQ